MSTTLLKFCSCCCVAVIVLCLFPGSWRLTNGTMNLGRLTCNCSLSLPGLMVPLVSLPGFMVPLVSSLPNQRHHEPGKRQKTITATRQQEQIYVKNLSHQSSVFTAIPRYPRKIQKAVCAVRSQSSPQQRSRFASKRCGVA